MAITKREHPRHTLFARATVKENDVGLRHRLLADRADFVAGSIFLFDNRGPDGDLLDLSAPELSPVEESARFKNKFNRRLRGLFHDLKAEELVSDEDLPLFYWPQSADARTRLAMRLRDIARGIRNAN
ncbi:MAG TPA: hypothetical protein VNC61_14440 [Acidimicrobiales bacterium]|nr:hypothetical protein [Acidimicrobiales bacterium]